VAAAAAAAAASLLSICVMLAGAGSGDVRVCGVAGCASGPGCGGKQMYHYSSVVACSSCSEMLGLPPIVSLQSIAVIICTNLHE
jgi:hypothetical protein